MARRLPPLNQLRAFEAAARHLSFKKAAEELNVTPAAISHQITALEAALEKKLFLRMTREVRLTQDGAVLLPSFTAAFDQLDDALRALNRGGSKPLCISSAPFFGNRWLLPRLPRFHAKHPEIHVEIRLDFDVVDLHGGDVDAGLRYGRADWPGLAAQLVCEDEISPVAAPALLGDRTPPLSPEEIAALPLAVATGSLDEWTEWFAAAGAPMIDVYPSAVFLNRALTLDFALTGNGVAIADWRIAASNVKAGNLVRLHPQSIPRDWGMFLVAPAERFQDPGLSAFADWLADEVATDDHVTAESAVS